MDNVEMLIGQLKDPDPSRRSAAIRGLAGTGDLRAADALTEALGDEHYIICREAVYPLADMGNAVQPKMIEALGHENPDVREGAAKVLIRVGDVRAVPALVETLDGSAKYEAIEALQCILYRCDSIQKVEEFKLRVEEGIERLGEKAKAGTIARWHKGDPISKLKKDMAAKREQVGAEMGGVQSKGTVPKPHGDPKGKMPAGKQPLKR